MQNVIWRTKRVAVPGGDKVSSLLVRSALWSVGWLLVCATGDCTAGWHVLTEGFVKSLVSDICLPQAARATFDLRRDRILTSHCHQQGCNTTNLLITAVKLMYLPSSAFGKTLYFSASLFLALKDIHSCRSQSTEAGIRHFLSKNAGVIYFSWLILKDMWITQSCTFSYCIYNIRNSSSEFSIDCIIEVIIQNSETFIYIYSLIEILFGWTPVG